MDRPHLIVLGAGAFQLDAIIEGQRLGFFVTALDGSPGAPGLSLADRGYVADIKDVDACLKIARVLRPAGVVTVASELAVPTLAAICEELHLKGPSTNAAFAATNKDRMRDLFIANGIACARYRKVASLAEVELAATELGYPVVVKPCDSSGSRGVMRVATLGAMAKAFEYAKQFSANGKVMVEEFMDGHEISVEGFVYCGTFFPLALSEKKRSDFPYLLDLEVHFPACLESDMEKEVLSLAEKGVHAIGVDMAPIHMEIMLTTDGPKIVEIAARGAGFQVFTRMLPWVTGVNVVKQSIIIATGGTPDFVIRENRAAILYFPRPLPGKVSAVSGLDYIRAISEVTDVEIFVKPGDMVSPLRSGIDRVGYIIIQAEDRSQAVNVLTDVTKALDICTAG